MSRLEVPNGHQYTFEAELKLSIGYSFIGYSYPRKWIKLILRSYFQKYKISRNIYLGTSECEWVKDFCPDKLYHTYKFQGELYKCP